MPEWNRATLGNQARELGFVRDTYEKVCRLTDVLAFMEGDELLADALALKGGTAINLTIFKLPRLSVDIDLDFTQNLNRDDMIATRTKINERLGKFMNANGYIQSSKSKNFHALDSFVYEYLNSGGMKDNIKVETNYMLRCHVLPLSRRQIDLPWQTKALSVLCVDPIEIFASKIVALLTRTAARDLYDVYNLLKSGLFDESQKTMLRKCIVFYSAIGTETAPLEFQFGSLQKVTQSRIKTDLYPVIRNDERFNLQEAQAQVSAWLTSSLVLDSGERTFLEAFRRKEYRPELLFSDAKIIDRIKDHPMALWKCSPRSE